MLDVDVEMNIFAGISGMFFEIKLPLKKEILMNCCKTKSTYKGFVLNCR